MSEDEILKKYSQTFGVTQNLERDIIEFLSAKHTQNATLTVQEVMSMYDCPADRARRVIDTLVRDNVLEAAGVNEYKVII